VPDVTVTSGVLGGGFIAGILGWFGKRQLARIDSLEKYSADKKDLDHMTTTIMDHITTTNIDTKTELSRTNDRIDTMLLRRENRD
jgi:hypothetical protein